MIRHRKWNPDVWVVVRQTNFLESSNDQNEQILRKLRHTGMSHTDISNYEKNKRKCENMELKNASNY